MWRFLGITIRRGDRLELSADGGQTWEHYCTIRLEDQAENAARLLNRLPVDMGGEIIGRISRN